MKSLGFAGQPMVFESGTSYVKRGEALAQAATIAVRRGGPWEGVDEARSLPQAANGGDAGDICVSLTPLQRMIREVLDPLALHKRPVKEWRSLYKYYFAFFAPDGSADETERKAWAIAADVFNTNLVAVCNRTTQVVPMTFQDFVDGVDSFRHDGLREGTQRDIAWQPKKILLLMAAMIGRILAGWQADAGSARQPRQDLLPFRDYLITENRKAAFLRSVFDYDPRFSILEYPSCGVETRAACLSSFCPCAHGKRNVPM